MEETNSSEETSLKDFDLSNRTYNALMRNRVRTDKDLYAQIEKYHGLRGITRMKGIGERCVNEIIDKFELNEYKEKI